MLVTLYTECTQTTVLHDMRINSIASLVCCAVEDRVGSGRLRSGRLRSGKAVLYYASTDRHWQMESQPTNDGIAR